MALAPDSPDIRNLRTQLAARALELASFQLHAWGSVLAQVCARLASGLAPSFPCLHPHPCAGTPLRFHHCGTGLLLRGSRSHGVLRGVRFTTERDAGGPDERGGGRDRVEGGRIGRLDDGYSNGGTRPRSCFPWAERYSLLLAHHDLVAAIHAARRRLSALAGSSPRLSACALGPRACVQPNHKPPTARTLLRLLLGAFRLLLALGLTRRLQ
jgi:hypothetical protein